MPPTIVPVSPRKPPSLKRLLLITLSVDVVLVPMAVWLIARTGQWMLLVWLGTWHLMLPLIVRMQVAVRRNQVERLEVSGEQINVVTSRGLGSGLERASGELVRIRRFGDGAVLKLVGPSGNETGMVMLPVVDIAVLRRALLEHGWSVQDGEDGEVAAPSVAVEARAEPTGTTLVLREGVLKVGVRSPISSILLGLGVLPVLLGGLFLDTASPLFQPMLIGPWIIVLVVVWTTVAVKAQRHDMTVSPDRIIVRAGTITRTADRARIARARPGKRQMRFTDADGRLLMQVPLSWKRDEVIDLLRSQGWPTY